MPRNAARVICGNCETPFIFKEYEETYEARSAWEEVVATLGVAVEEAKTVYDTATVNLDKARLEVCEHTHLVRGYR